MFTGIVKGRATVREIEKRQGLYTLKIAFPKDFDEGLEIGASVAVDGVCLTVTAHAIDGGTLSYQWMRGSTSVGTFRQRGK